MSQNEQSSTAVPGSTVDRQQQRAQQSSDHNWCIRKRDTNEIVKTFHADNYEAAFAYLQQYKRANGIDPDENNLTYGPYDPQQERQPVRDINLFPEIEPTQREFTGTWLVKNENNGEVLHRISGIGNVQADANRIAGQWVRQNSIAVPIEVVPEMA